MGDPKTILAEIKQNTCQETLANLMSTSKNQDCNFANQAADLSSRSMTFGFFHFTTTGMIIVQWQNQNEYDIGQYYGMVTGSLHRKQWSIVVHRGYD